MFSLIIVILSVLLVAALALVVMYYGGDSMSQGTAKADASKVLNQGQQLMGAADLYKSDTGDWPPSLEALTLGNYLKSVPEGAYGKNWVMPQTRVPTFVLEGVKKDSCTLVNALSFKVEGVFNQLSSSYATQCYSPSDDEFTVVVSKAGQYLAPGGTEICETSPDTTLPGLPGLDPVSCKPVPEKDCENPGWVVPPKSCGPDTDGPGPEGPGGPEVPTNPDAAQVRYYVDGVETAQIDLLGNYEGQYLEREVMIRNVSGNSLTFAANWTVAAPFELSYNTCAGETIANGLSCYVGITYPYVTSGTQTAQFLPLKDGTQLSGIPVYGDLVPLPAELTLDGTSLPKGKLNVEYPPFNFNGLLNYSNPNGGEGEGAGAGQPVLESNVVWTVSPLPPGMTFQNGILAGTPTELTIEEGLTIEVTAEYAGLTVTTPYTWRVTAGLPLVARQVSSGWTLTCAVTFSNAVKCWGMNDIMQLGENADSYVMRYPVQIKGLESGVNSVEAGSKNACALMMNGKVKCWGYGGNYNLGNGVDKNSAIPVEVVGINNAVQLSFSGHYGCVLESNGTLKCWGMDPDGFLDGPVWQPSRTAILMPTAPTDIRQIAIAGSSLCVLRTNDTVECMGMDAHGALGRGTVGDEDGPLLSMDFKKDFAPVVNGGNVRSLANSSGAHTHCVIKTNGQPYCWGLNYNRNVTATATWGIGSATPSWNMGTDTVAMNALSTSMCGLRTNGNVRCWWKEGGDEYAINAKAISAGVNHACALTFDNHVKCWGSNSYGQLGNGVDSEDSAVPVTVND
ncbi:hypothetical protein LC612_39910 [Nostoc sp. CHAB 5834]|nr:hypothetical protein [Nostoc sp. CHAB 5834]